MVVGFGFFIGLNVLLRDYSLLLWFRRWFLGVEFACDGCFFVCCGGFVCCFKLALICFSFVGYRLVGSLGMVLLCELWI